MLMVRTVVVAVLLALSVPAVASADRLTVRGTKAFRSVVPDTPTQFGAEFASFAGALYFVADDDVHGNELWRTDGTDGGTALVADLNPGLPSSSSNPHRLTVVGDRLVFNAYDPVSQSTEAVFFIDAAAPTTVRRPSARRVTDGVPIPAVGSIFGAPNGRVVISRLLGEQQNCCYAVYSLPPGGTVMTKISAGAEDVGTNNVFSPSATARGWTYYSRSNTNVSPGEGAELWRTNGSITEGVKDIYPGKGGGSAPSGFVATSDRVYFLADDGVHGRELWQTNPADRADTRLVYEHTPGTAGTSIEDPGPVANGGVLYYVPSDPGTGSELWRTDGTRAGTRVVRDITPGSGGQASIKAFPLRGGVGFLRGSGVWASTDGSDAGTSLLGEVDGDGYGPNSPVVLGDRAYFAGGFTPFGQALWRTDGSAGGTGALSAGGFDGTGATSGSPAVQTLAVLGSRLIFFGRDPSTNDTGAVKLYVIDTTQPDEVRRAATAPSISGTPAPDQQLTGDQGSWTLESRYSYEWLRNGTPVPNALGTTYAVSSADVGAQLTFRVRAVGIGLPNAVVAESAPVTVAAAGGPPVVPGPTPAPRPGTTTTTPTPVAVLKTLRVAKAGRLTGSARVGGTLRVRRPRLAESGVTFSYRWTAGGKTIKKQTTSTLKLARAQQGKRVSVVVKLRKSGFRTRSITIGPSAKVRRAAR